jgi:hypothetical protein
MFWANKPFSNSFQSEPIQTEVLFLISIFCKQQLLKTGCKLNTVVTGPLDCGILNLPVHQMLPRTIATRKADWTTVGLAETCNMRLFTNDIGTVPACFTSLFSFYYPFFVLFIFSLSIFVLIILIPIQRFHFSIFIFTCAITCLN